MLCSFGKYGRWWLQTFLEEIILRTCEVSIHSVRYLILTNTIHLRLLEGNLEISPKLSRLSLIKSIENEAEMCMAGDSFNWVVGWRGSCTSSLHTTILMGQQALKMHWLLHFWGRYFLYLSVRSLLYHETCTQVSWPAREWRPEKKVIKAKKASVFHSYADRQPTHRIMQTKNTISKNRNIFYMIGDKERFLMCKKIQLIFWSERRVAGWLGLSSSFNLTSLDIIATPQRANKGWQNGSMLLDKTPRIRPLCMAGVEVRRGNYTDCAEKQNFFKTKFCN